MGRVLFVCKQNAGRSQMSDALFQRIAGGRHESRSAGTRPVEQVHPQVVAAMAELGIDLAGQRPSKLTEEAAHWADVVVTMGCGDECPYIPGKTYIDWNLTDPAGKSLEVVRGIRDDINDRVRTLATDLEGTIRAGY